MSPTCDRCGQALKEVERANLDQSKAAGNAMLLGQWLYEARERLKIIEEAARAVEKDAVEATQVWGMDGPWVFVRKYLMDALTAALEKNPQVLGETPERKD